MDQAFWMQGASYAKTCGSLSQCIDQWADDAISGGVRSPVILERPIKLDHWSTAVMRLSIYQAAELAAMRAGTDDDR